MRIDIAISRGWINHGDGTWHNGKYIYRTYQCIECGSDFLADRSQRYCSKKCVPLPFEADWRKGKKFFNEKGGVGRKRKTGLGYIEIYLPGNPMADIKGRVGEHRFIISEEIGRPLSKTEHVHHINGKRDDNRRENLVLLSQFDHNSLHKKEQVKRFNRNEQGKFTA